MKKYKFIGYAPKRNPYDSDYLMFMNNDTKEFVYRKALNTNLQPSGKGFRREMLDVAAVRSSLFPAGK